MRESIHRAACNDKLQKQVRLTVRLRQAGYCMPKSPASYLLNDLSLLTHTVLYFAPIL